MNKTITLNYTEIECLRHHLRKNHKKERFDTRESQNNDYLRLKLAREIKALLLKKKENYEYTLTDWLEYQKFVNVDNLFQLLFFSKDFYSHNFLQKLIIYFKEDEKTI